MFHVIVADGHAVRVFETDSKGAVLYELVVYRSQVGRHERDLVAARPGRVINRAAGIRQTFDPKVSAKQRLTQRWMKLVGLQLEPFLASRGSEGVILVAGPRMLADLRRLLPAETRARIRAEIARDLAHQPKVALRKRLQPVVRAAARSVLQSSIVPSRRHAVLGRPS
jgi:protein required for attachment to host cells